MVRMTTDFQPCPAVTATAKTPSSVPATTVTGGAPLQPMPSTFGAGTCITTASTCAGAATPKRTCSRCVVSKIMCDLLAKQNRTTVHVGFAVKSEAGDAVVQAVIQTAVGGILWGLPLGRVMNAIGYDMEHDSRKPVFERKTAGVWRFRAGKKGLPVLPSAKAVVL